VVFVAAQFNLVVETTETLGYNSHKLLLLNYSLSVGGVSRGGIAIRKGFDVCDILLYGIPRPPRTFSSDDYYFYSSYSFPLLLLLRLTLFLHLYSSYSPSNYKIPPRTTAAPLAAPLSSK